MKNLFLLSFLFLLFGCNKNNPNLGKEYPYLVGEWKALHPELKDISFLSFKKNGHIKLEVGPLEGRNFYAKSYLVDIIDNVKYIGGKKSNESYIRLNKTHGQVDTIQVLIGTVSINDTLQSGYFTFYRTK